MKSRLLSILLVSILALLFGGLASAQTQKKDPPLKARFWPTSDKSQWQNIKGARFNLPAGKDNKITGADIGIVDMTNEMVGGQVSLGANINEDEVIGAQCTFGYNQTGNVRGAQLGTVNNSGRVRGAQVGLFNTSDMLDKGIQIGLLNRASNGFLPWFPFFNFNFD